MIGCFSRIVYRYSRLIISITIPQMKRVIGLCQADKFLPGRRASIMRDMEEIKSMTGHAPNLLADGMDITREFFGASACGRTPKNWEASGGASGEGCTAVHAGIRT